MINEDGVAPTNSAGGGQIAGIGVGPKGEPGVTAKWHKKHIERNKANAPSPIIAPVQTRKTLSDFVKGK